MAAFPPPVVVVFFIRRFLLFFLLSFFSANTRFGIAFCARDAEATRNGEGYEREALVPWRRTCAVLSPPFGFFSFSFSPVFDSRCLRRARVCRYSRPRCFWTVSFAACAPPPPFFFAPFNFPAEPRYIGDLWISSERRFFHSWPL